MHVQDVVMAITKLMFLTNVFLVFDAPLAFTIALLNPKTAKLKWKVPPQMRKQQLFFWYIVQYKIANTDADAIGMQTFILRNTACRVTVRLF